MRAGQGPEHQGIEEIQSAVGKAGSQKPKKSKISAPDIVYQLSQAPLLLQAFISEQAKRQNLISLFPCLLPKFLFKSSYRTE